MDIKRISLYFALFLVSLILWDSWQKEHQPVSTPTQTASATQSITSELPKGVEAQVRPRSGLAAKFGITVLNSPGTIDADYRGEIKVILVNLSNDTFIINDGERIAQMVLAKHEQAEWIVVEELESSERGEGGFGHTGKN